MTDKVAIVTGSTSGIGQGIAEVLASKGYHITLNGFGDAAQIKALQEQIEKQYKVKTFYSGADMSKPEQIEALVADTIKALGRVDVVVNNAGIQHVDYVEDFPVEKWNLIIAINLSAVFHMTRAIMPHMKKRGSGRIINIASAHGLVASAKKAAYVAAKHGVVGLTKTVALETAETGITCNAICPGWVLTPLVQKQIDDNAANQNISVKEAEKQLLSAKQPSNRFTTVEQLGELTAFLCSDAAGNITGTTLSVDGGWTAQ